MEIDITLIMAQVFGGVTAFFSHSFFFAALKFFLFVYIAVLIVDIVLLLMLKGLSSDFKRALYGTERPLVSRGKMITRWEAILARLESHNPSQYKVAVLEADALAHEILTGIGYPGATMTEKLENVKGGQLESKELLISAHEVRNHIVHEADFVLSREEAEQWLNSFKAFFDEVELF